MSDWAGLGLDRTRVALAILGLALVATIGAVGLFEPTETRYAEIAREMLESGDWLRPRLNGLSHFHKPPLAYWATAGGMATFGRDAAGARLPVALASLAVLICTAVAARRRFAALGIRPALSVWMLGTMLLFVAIGRALASDPFLAAAVAAYWALAPSPWALAALGAGFLAKGPVVFVHTALPVLLVALWRRERSMLAWLGPWPGWLLFAAIALPWYLVMVLRTPGLLDYLLGNQILGRYASTVHERGGPPGYFVGVLILGALPWSAALIAGLLRTWRDRAGPEAQLLLCWLLAPVAFLSFSGSKLPAYLLPCFPAAALLAVRGLENAAARRLTAGLLLAAAIAGAAFGPAAIGRLTGLEISLRAVLSFPALLALLLLVYAAWGVARARPARAALYLTLLLTVLVVTLAPYDSMLGSPRRIARLLIEQRAPGEPVVEIGRFNAGLPFYLGEPVHLLEVRREEGFDDLARVRATIVTGDSLVAWSERHRRVWTFGAERRTAEIAHSTGLRYTIVARWRRITLGFLAR